MNGPNEMLKHKFTNMPGVNLSNDLYELGRLDYKIWWKLELTGKIYLKAYPA